MMSDFNFSDTPDWLKKIWKLFSIKNLNAVPLTERVRRVYNATNKAKAWPSTTFSSFKSGRKSKELRKMSLDLYHKGMYEEALLRSTQSVAAAVENNAKSVLHAFSHRSFLLFRHGKYFSSLQDINRVLNHRECTDSLRADLAKRKQICEAEIIKSNVRKSKFLAQCSDELKSLQSVDNLVKTMLESTNFVDIGDEPLEVLCGLSKIDSENELLSNAISDVKVNFSLKYGRHLLATSKINPGDLIAVEKPFSSVLQPEFIFTHCSACFVRNDALIPCGGCAEVMYCGKKCRDEAFRLYHRTECHILPILKNLGYNYLEILVLRTMLIGTNQGKIVDGLLLDPNFEDLFPEKGKYTFVNEKFASDYSKICQLERASEHSLHSSAGYIAKCALILHILKQKSFFGDNSSGDKLTEAEILVGNLLLNHYHIMKSNPFGVEETALEKESVSSTKRVGAALYGLLSLVNHSCDANARVYFNKHNIVMYANHAIPRGGQVFVCYGDLYYQSALRVRQEHLKQYGFKCRCEACVSDWPLYLNLPKQTTFQYEIISQLDVLKGKVRKSLDIRRNIVPDSVLKCFYEFSNLINSCFRKPMLAFVRCDYAIERLMPLKGNFYVEGADVFDRLETLESYVLKMDPCELLDSLQN